MQEKTLKNKLATITILMLLISPLLIQGTACLDLKQTTEYNQYVHTNIYTDSNQANTTYLDKPIFPVYFNTSQISVGASWTISCPLITGHNYRIFCYGTWVSSSATAATDYDIEVYDPSGTMETSHTEAASVTEYITSGSSDLFTPKKSGNYTFIMKNDARESAHAEQATFMIIESLEANQWYTETIEGKASDSSSKLKTAWAYEFTTNDSYVEVYVDVPSSLDMYEARLYLMNDATSPTVNSNPLPAESGLYGNVSGTGVGGYNFDSKGSRGVSYASCASSGQDMVLNYSCSNAGTKVYYLVLIGEEGYGNVEVLFKTIFSDITLSQVGTLGKVYPNTPISLSFVTDSSNLAAANLTYSTDNWGTTEYIPMVISSRTCNATIPAQSAGKTVQYKVDAIDVVKNTMSASGSYSVKAQPKLTIDLASEEAFTGENITVTGQMTPAAANAIVTLTFFSSQETQTVSCEVNSDGTFTGAYAPTTTGDWAVLANVPETTSTWTVDSSQYVISVKEMPLYQKYATYIAVALILLLFVGGSIYFLKFNK